jgi:hypothetical protein
MAGDLRAELDVVLSPGSAVAIALLAGDGNALSAGMRAWRQRPSREEREKLRHEPRLDPDAGALLAAGNPRQPVSGVALGVAPGVPHHLELRRSGDETRVLIDGREVLRSDLPFAEDYRIAVTSPEGGVELRSLVWSADAEREPATRS